MTTEEFSADFEFNEEDRARFLKTISDKLVEQQGWTDASQLKLEIREIKKLSFEGTSPRVYMKLSCGKMSVKASWQLDDYAPEKHEECVQDMIDKIAQDNDWDPANVKLVEVWQLGDDEDAGIVGEGAKPPPKRRQSVASQLIAAMSGKKSSVVPTHKVISVVPATQ